MSESGMNKLYSQIDMLSYSERICLLGKIIQSLHTPSKTVKTQSSDFSAAFGLWKDRDISVEEIRSKAWSRS
jgi:hypothetical protein